jgi:DNA-binding response OmpR family regulator
VDQKFAGKKILVVDDDPDILTAIKMAFDDTGAEVFTVTDGNAAVRAVTDNAPDLVVLDIMLPQKSGFLVLERIRQAKPRAEGPKVIMITGNQGKRHKQYAEALGVDAYINKPFHMELLVGEAEKILLH